MRPRRPRRQDNNNGVSYLHSHRCFSAHKNSVGVRHSSPHIPQYRSSAALYDVRSENDEQTPGSMHHNLSVSDHVCDPNCSILINSAITDNSSNFILQGHIPNDGILHRSFATPCQRAMHEGGASHKYNINYNSDGDILPIRSNTAKFNHRSFTRNASQKRGLESQVSFPLPLFSEQPKSLSQTEALNRHIGPTPNRQKRAHSVFSAARVLEFDNASHEYRGNFYFPTQHLLLPQASSNLRCQIDSIIAENLQRNDNGGKQRDCHDANILVPKQTTFELSNVGGIRAGHKHYHHDGRLPIILDTPAKIQDRKNLVPGEAIDVGVKEKIVNERVFEPTCASVHRCLLVPAFPQNTFSHTYSSQFSMQSSHSLSMQFDTSSVLVLKAVRITPLLSRARLLMPPLLASVSYMQSEPQECEGALKSRNRVLGSDASSTNITGNSRQRETISVTDSLEADDVKMNLANKQKALKHMSVGSGHNPLSKIPLGFLPCSITSCRLASPNSPKCSTMHSPNDNFCNPNGYSSFTSSTPYCVTNRQGNFTHRKHSWLSNTSILEATAELVMEMIATPTCNSTPDSELLPVEVTPAVPGRVVASKEVSLQLSPQHPIMVAQRVKQTLSFTQNSNAFSSKKSLGTFDGLTRPNGTTPEESTEIELYRSESISGIEFSHSPIAVSVNPNSFSLPFNNSVFPPRRD